MDNYPPEEELYRGHDPKSLTADMVIVCECGWRNSQINCNWSETGAEYDQHLLEIGHKKVRTWQKEKARMLAG